MTDAADAYDRAREMEPDNPEYIGNLARAKIRHGDSDTETKELLEELAFKDSRPQWTNWAKENLIRLSHPTTPEIEEPTTRPTTR